MYGCGYNPFEVFFGGEAARMCTKFAKNVSAFLIVTLRKPEYAPIRRIAARPFPSTRTDGHRFIF
jgi:hypothetical protein